MKMLNECHFIKLSKMPGKRAYRSECGSIRRREVGGGPGDMATWRHGDMVARCRYHGGKRPARWDLGFQCEIRVLSALFLSRCTYIHKNKSIAIKENVSLIRRRKISGDECVYESLYRRVVSLAKHGTFGHLEDKCMGYMRKPGGNILVLLVQVTIQLFLASTGRKAGD